MRKSRIKNTIKKFSSYTMALALCVSMVLPSAVYADPAEDIGISIEMEEEAKNETTSEATSEQTREENTAEQNSTESLSEPVSEGSEIIMEDPVSEPEASSEEQISPAEESSTQEEKSSAEATEPETETTIDMTEEEDPEAETTEVEKEPAEIPEDKETVIQFNLANPKIFSEEQIGDPIEIEQEVDPSQQEKFFRARRTAPAKTTIAEAGAMLKEVMMAKGKEVVIPINLSVPVEEEDYAKYSEYYRSRPSERQMRIIKLTAQILEAASEHTGVYNEGDYLLFNFATCDFAFDSTPQSDLCVGNLTLSNIEYLTTADEEEIIEQKVNQIISENGLESMNDYDKIKFVYEYLYNNVDYDTEHADDDSYYRQFSAIGALVDGKAVCQGYANAAYMILNKLGVDTRIISGLNGAHSWLIVKLSGKYYNLDPTWDGTAASSTEDFRYFLKGSDNFASSHPADWQYTTEEFINKFPIDTKDFSWGNILLSDSELTMKEGETHILKAEAQSGEQVSFKSDDEAIATVTQAGKITAMSNGVTNITAYTEHGSAVCVVTVSSPYTVTIAVKDSVTKDVTGAGEYYQNDVVTLTAPEQTESGYKFLKWEFSTDITIMDGKQPTSPQVSFSMPEKDVIAMAYYEEIKVNAIILDKSSVTLNKAGDTAKVNATVEPANATNKSILITSENTSVATVNSEGLITAVAPGTTKIIFTAGDATASCTVTVANQEYLISVIGRNSSGVEKTQSKTVKAGETITISVPDLTNIGYQFNGWTATPSTVTYTKGTKASDLKVSFIMPESDLTMKANYSQVSVSSVTLSASSLTLDVSDSYTLKASVSPAGAYNSTVSYVSSNSSVASVSSSGVVYAQQAGTATITATAGGVSATCQVTVKAKETTPDNQNTPGNTANSYLRVNASSVKMYAGRQYQLSVTSSNVGSISYDSSNTSVATVSSSGVIYGVAPGICTITVSGSEGNKSATVNVTIVESPNSSSSYTTNTPTYYNNGTTSRTTYSTTNRKTSTVTTNEDGTVSGSIQGRRTYDTSAASNYKSLAVKYKADADKIRADALRQGSWNSDGSAKTRQTSSSETAESKQTQQTEQTQTKQTSETTQDVVAVNGSSAEYRSTQSSETGDRSMLYLAFPASFAALAILIAAKKRKEIQ